MIDKKRAIKWTVIFFATVLICTFSAKTVYYFTLPKVSTDKPRPGTFTEITTLSQGELEVKGAIAQKLELPAPISIDEIYVRKGQAISAGDTILRFSTEDIHKQMKMLEKQRESASIALSEFSRNFNLRVTALREQVRKNVNSNSAKEELDYMLTTGIMNGRTEKQLRETLDEMELALAQLTVLAETGVVTAEADGLITAMPLQKGVMFSGGTLLEYASEGAKYQVTFHAGNLTEVEIGQSCVIRYYLNGVLQMVNGKVGDVGLSYVTVESAQFNHQTMQAQNFAADITLSKINAALTVPVSAMATSTSVFVVEVKSSVLGDRYVLSRREVATGQEDQSNVEIVSGLTKDDEIVIAWDRALRDGAVVDVIKGN